MSHVCFYPCCKDVFDILQVDGITYYVLDKNSVFDKCIVVNKSTYIKKLTDQALEKRSILNREPLINVGSEIYNYIMTQKCYTPFRFMTISRLKKYQVWTNSQIPGGALSALSAERKTLFIGESYIEDRNLQLEHSTAANCTFEADNMNGVRALYHV